MRTRKNLAVNLVGWAFGLIWLVPFIGVFMTAVRPMDELLHGWWDFSQFHPTLSNFVGALNHPTAPLKIGLINSLRVAVAATIFPIILATMAGYYIARYDFPLRKTVFTIIVLTLALPQQMIAVPIYQLLLKLNLLDTFTGLIILHTSWGIPWITFFMRNFFTTLPTEIEEAARIDGAGDVRIFFKIALPLSLPALGSAAALQFTWVWSSFFLELITIYSPEKLLATQRIPLMRGVYHVDWGILSAAAITVMAVPIAVYLLLQRYYVRGMIGWSMK